VEDDLLQSETRNKALLSAVPDLIFRIRRDGVFLDFKSTPDSLLLLPADQIIGASINEIMDASISDKAMLCIEMALLSKETQTLEYTLKVGNSSHVFEARFKDSGEDEVTAIIRDVSARARLEQMKSDFINRASHELRTPIATMLLGFTGNKECAEQIGSTFCFCQAVKRKSRRQLCNPQAVSMTKSSNPSRKLR